jgi:protein-S-isoprenylcysteine O-methyltransferase Ste14
MARRLRLPAVFAALILALLVAGAVSALAQQSEELPPEAAAGIAIGALVIAGLAIIIGLAIQIGIMVFLYRDAEARGQSGVLWAILGFLFPLLALIIWLIIRPKQ